MMELFEDDLLIAADFCHLIDGGAIYVATRYSNRDKGALSPGFLMSLASVKEFCRRGATIWDLGQTDRNPIMVTRSLFIHYFFVSDSFFVSGVQEHCFKSASSSCDYAEIGSKQRDKSSCCCSRRIDSLTQGRRFDE